ncbi:MAG: anion permease [Planctomycetaceae bacterium]|nr:anion permease [Planctomycetaceae bacterium]
MALNSTDTRISARTTFDAGKRDARLKSLSPFARGMVRTVGMFAMAALVAVLTHLSSLNFGQVMSASVFTLIIMATLLFWNFRLAIAFMGIGLLMILGVMDIPSLIAESKLDVILFLIGMMITVGVLKDLGLFTWIILTIISARRMTGQLFVALSCVMGAIMACLVDEVTSIVFISALIFQVCDTLKLKPVPFIMMAVMATNIGSAGTMLGNPVGILIGQNASPPLSFIDFMHWSFPLMIVEFTVVFFLLLYLFRKDIAAMSEKLRERRAQGIPLGPIVKVPYQKSLAILILLVGFLALHSSMERWLGLPTNTMLIMTPLILSGILMVARPNHARKYIEHDVEWWTLMFFMMLFAVAGALEHTKVTEAMANGFASTFGESPVVLVPVILGLSAIGSAFVDNIVFVAAFMPVVTKLEQTPLLWALLHGACLGGNITMIGSTANIVSLGMMEKRYRTGVNFFAWFKTGILVGAVSCLAAWGGIAVLSPYMPTKAERMHKVGLVGQVEAVVVDPTPPSP